MSRILVVKLGALGNVILSLGPFAAIRRHHATDHITLLTMRPWADWLGQSPYFDTVLIDERPEWWDVARLATPAPATHRRAVRPGLRSADLVPVLALFPSVPARARDRNGLALRMAARIPTATRTAIACTTSIASSISFARLA